MIGVESAVGVGAGELGIEMMRRAARRAELLRRRSGGASRRKGNLNFLLLERGLRKELLVGNGFL